MPADTQTLRTTLVADYDALATQIAGLRDEMSTMAQTFAASSAKRGKAMADDVAEGMSEAMTYVGRKGHAADMRVESAIAGNPYIAVGLAAAVGLVLGAMTRR
jgi:ElaB/YqjD/DUF883 family membrane-anchored ribosome-binding protein